MNDIIHSQVHVVSMEFHSQYMLTMETTFIRVLIFDNVYLPATIQVMLF